jgi:glutaredoxin 3
MARIQMYTTRWCGYCVRAKTLLDSRGIPFEEI